MKEMTSHQRSLYMKLKYWLSKPDSWPGHKITKDDGAFLHVNNGKRFLAFNLLDFPEQVLFMNVREDGDTRTAFNGFIQDFDQFKIIWKNLW